jgi:hypothetical protein
MTAAERIVVRQSLQRAPGCVRAWWTAHGEAVRAALLVVAGCALYVFQSWLDERDRRAAVERVLLRQRAEIVHLRAKEQYWRDTPCIPAPPWNGTGGAARPRAGVRT